jgi:hypothetical protein
VDGDVDEGARGEFDGAVSEIPAFGSEHFAAWAESYEDVFPFLMSGGRRYFFNSAAQLRTTVNGMA